MNRRNAVVIPGKPPATVTQAELQEVLDLQNRVEVLMFGIRKRLEAGASLERGPLGASAVTLQTLKELAKSGIGDATQADGYGILNIAPADRIKRECERWAELTHEVWVA